MSRKHIGVIGSGINVPAEVARIAEEVGERIAKAGCYLVCGGREGVMEAACRGAKRAGGMTIGILPEDTRENANEFVDISIPTGLGYAMRNIITIRTCDSVIMIHGGGGTLSEAILCYQFKKPLVVLENSDGWAGRMRQVAYNDGAYIDQRNLIRIQYVKTPEDAVRLALDLLDNSIDR